VILVAQGRSEETIRARDLIADRIQVGDTDGARIVIGTRKERDGGGPALVVYDKAGAERVVCGLIVAERSTKASVSVIGRGRSGSQRNRGELSVLEGGKAPEPVQLDLVSSGEYRIEMYSTNTAGAHLRFMEPSKRPTPVGPSPRTSAKERISLGVASGRAAIDLRSGYERDRAGHRRRGSSW
jgi:hypothetical protein